MKKEKTTFDIVTDVALAFLVPMALAGVWFLINVRWWM